MNSQSPHTMHQWPFNAHSHRVALLREALTGADALAQLLKADNAIRDNVGDSDAPEHEDQPFSDVVRSALHNALSACLYQANSVAEDLEKARGKP